MAGGSGLGPDGAGSRPDAEGDAHRRVELQRLARLVDTGPEEAFDRLTRLARRITGAPIALISMVGVDRQFFKSADGLAETLRTEARETPLHQSVCRTVVGTDAPLVLEDLALDPVFCEHPALTEFHLGSYLGYPVHAPDGTPLGSLCVMGTEPRAWTEGDQEAVRDLAALAEQEVALRIQAEDAWLRARDARQEADREAAEKAFLRGIFDALPMAVALQDGVGRTLGFNARWEELPRGASDEAPAFLDDPEVVAGLARVRRGEAEEYLKDLNRWEEGRERWFRLRAAGIPVEGGRRVIVRFEDRTRLREAESLLHLLRSAVDRINDFLLITTAEAPGAAESRRGPPIVFANRAFLERTGYAPHEVVGKRLRFPDPVEEPGGEGGEGGEEGRDPLLEGFVAGRAVRAEVLNRDRQGERFWVEADLVPLPDARGEVTHWVSVQRDVTRRRERDARLAAQEEALRIQDRLEVVGRLAAGVAHEFNNLLTVIVANVGLLELDAGAAGIPPELEEVRGAAEEAATLVAHLLALSRKQVLRVEEIEVGPILREVLAVLRGARGRGKRVHLHLGTGTPRVRADAQRLEQALLNLAVNAADVLDAECGGRGMVELRAFAFQVETPRPTRDGAALDPGRYLAVEVADSGPGVAPEREHRIFEPFVSDRPEVEGRGLGLSTALGIVRQMGGTIEVARDRLLGGACFRVLLPAVEP